MTSDKSIVLNLMTEKGFEVLKNINRFRRLIAFVVVGKDRKNPSDRIRLKSEIELESSSILGQKPDFEYYHTLALRATFALLSPFGISEDDILSRGCVQTTLDTWLSISTSCKSDM